MRSSLTLLACAPLLPACFEIPGSKDVSSDFEAVCADSATGIIDGDLDLSAATAEDVASLTCVTEITGSLTVAGNTELTALVGLENLSAVGALSISDNPALLSLDGLSALRSVGTELYIARNAGLADLSALAALATVGAGADTGGFEISDNPALTTLTGLGAMRISVLGVSITDNASLCAGDVTMFHFISEVSSEGFDSRGNDGACPVYEGNPADVSSDPCSEYYSMTVEDDVYLGSTATAASVDSLRCVTAISGVFSVGPNDGLTDLDGLGPLTQVGSLTIADVPNLTQIEGLAWLTTVGGDVAITANDRLEAVDLVSLSTVGGQLFIGENAALTDLYGLYSLEEVGSYFTISDNASLSALWGCCMLEHLSSDLVIENNDALTSFGSFALSEIDGQLQVVGNDALTDLSGLDSLTSVGGALWIAENSDLEDLSGLGRLASVTGMLGIHANPSLVSISEMSALSSVGSVQVDENTSLCESDVEDFFAFFSGYIYNDHNGGC